MLKEGWDVRNVTTIVGLRAYAAQSNILPEQTLGSRSAAHVFRLGYSGNRLGDGHPRLHGIRRVHPERGRHLRTRANGAGQPTREDSLIVEVDAQNTEKDLDALDIELPRLTRRFNREYKDLDALDPANFGNPKLPLKPFTPEETREIVFKTMLDAEVHHTIQLEGAGPADYRSVVGFFARQLLKEMRLVGGYDLLYPKVKTFMAEHLFAGSPVNLEDPVVLRNLSEPEAGKILFDSFKTAINALTVQDTGSARIEDRIRLRDTRPFRTENRPYLAPKKSLFSKIVGEPHAGGFELAFAGFLDARSGRRRVRQELPRRRLQDRLRQGRRRSLELCPRLRREDHRWHGLDRRDQGPGGDSTCRRRWPVCASGARMRRARARRRAVRPTASCTWTSKATSATRQGISPG